MTEKEKIDKKNPIEVASNLLDALTKIEDDPRIKPLGLDIHLPEDRSIAIRLLLRGKKENDYWRLVEGLHELSENLSNKFPENAETVRGICGEIMNIGEENLGIDWS